MIRKWAIAAVVSLLACSEHKPAPSAAPDAQPGAERDESEQPEAPQEKGGGGESIRHDENAFSAQVAGGFYPDDPGKLRETIEGFLEQADSAGTAGDRDIVGILSPHAGYRYSGPVAGEAFRAVQGRDYRTVVVISLNHRRAADKPALLDRSAYDTPLGSLEIDRRAVRRLLDEHGGVFAADENVFRGEHSLEVQLPFVQVALPEAEIVPIIVAVRDEGLVERAGAALWEEFGERGDVLFVLSSDLSHHHPYEQARQLDDRNLDLLESWQIEKWRAAASRPSEGMCGYRPLLAFVSFFGRYPEKKREVERIDYRNSGDTAGNKSRVVGYGALAFSVERGMREESGNETDYGPYGLKERRELISLAKRAVAAAVEGEKLDPKPPGPEVLAEKGAAFVTLKKNGELRGCIGHVIARVPLYECVADVARAAAIRDARFSPVAPEELDDLSYQISVLTAPEPIEPEKVVIGRDGLIMSRGGRSGLLLPQVPVEWGWDREEFLEHTCRKAGLPRGCWRDSETELRAFRAIVWDEDDLDE